MCQQGSGPAGYRSEKTNPACPMIRREPCAQIETQMQSNRPRSRIKPSPESVMPPPLAHQLALPEPDATVSGRLFDMHNPMLPDPPGTINPLKLSIWAETLPNLDSSDCTDPPAPPETTPMTTGAVSQGTRAAARPPSPPDATIPRLTSISSDCVLKDDPLLRMSAGYEAMRQEFEQSFADGSRSSSRGARPLSHHGYFRGQTRGPADTFIPPDPDADLDQSVVVDKVSGSIYDAYLLRVDVAKNINAFHRHQVC